MLLVRHWLLLCISLVVHFIKPEVLRMLIAYMNRKICISTAVVMACGPLRNLHAPLKDHAENPDNLLFANWKTYIK